MSDRYQKRAYSSYTVPCCVCGEPCEKASRVLLDRDRQSQGKSYVLHPGCAELEESEETES
jgi:hypothetical protein